MFTMSDEKIRQTLKSLHDELENAGAVDPDLRSLLRDVDDDIRKLLGTSDQAPDSLMQSVDDLAAGFAASHPQAERFLRELVDALGKLGI